MEIDEVIATLTDLKAYGSFGPYCTDEIEALDMAISTLRAQQEAEKNEPLTWREISQISGKPIYVVEKEIYGRYISYWAIVSHFNEEHGEVGLCHIDNESDYGNSDCYGTAWNCYRHPPKEAPMSDMLPCPFCGGEAQTNETAGIPKENLPSGWGWVGCQHCRVFMTYCHGERGKKKAVEAWNRRYKEG